MRFYSHGYKPVLVIGDYEYSIEEEIDDEGHEIIRHHCFKNGEEVVLMKYINKFSPHRKLDQHEFISFINMNESLGTSKWALQIKKRLVQ